MQKRVPEEAPSHVLFRIFCTHFFDIASKSRSWVSLHKKSVHARVQKPFRKKRKKTRSGVPPEQRTPRQDLKMRKCVYCKVKEPRDNPHRKWQQERDPERPAPTYFIGSFYFEKTCFFLTCFFKYANWTLGANFGASLTRPAPTRHRGTVFFQKNTCFLQKNLVFSTST